MKKISNKTVIAICLIAIALTIYYYQNVKEYEVDLPVTGVIVAKSTIPPNTIITKDMIYLDNRLTQDMLKQKGDITAKEENILGKRSKETIFKEEPINMKRLIENELYMDEIDGIKRTMFVIAISNTDKALSIAKGNYIDLWLELNENGIMEVQNTEGEQSKSNQELKFDSFPLFTKMKVYDVKTETYGKVDNSAKDSEETIVTYLTLYLTDAEIATYLDIKDWNVTKRVTLYGENVEYLIINEKLNVKESQEESTEVPTENNKVDSVDGLVGN